MPSHRMHRGLVALSASAVAAVYITGYVRTQAADSSIGAASVTTQATAVVAAAPALSPTPLPVVIQRVTPGAARLGATPSANATGTAVASGASTGQTGASAAAAATGQAGSSGQSGSGGQSGHSGQSGGTLKDGTFSGQGTSRRGDVWVSVQVQDGRIANVSITRSTLQYPLRDIAALPDEVLQRQTAQVDVVSRATYSSMAFRGAVAQALAAASSA